MNAKVFLDRFSFKRDGHLKSYYSAILLLLASGGAVQANEILAGALLSGVSLGKGDYAYTLILDNTTASTSDIQMFWFGWEAGQADFLTSEPTSIQTPAGWIATVDGGGAGDGYSVQFVTFTTPLTPGSSLTFTFHSADSPKVMAGPASLYPEYQTLTSQVYSAHAADGLQEVFVAQILPAAASTNLTIALVDHQLVLAWPTNAGNVVLQTTTNLFSQTSWTNVANIPSISGPLDTVTLPATTTSQFFRLQSQ